jgi:hypothetical protein
MATRKTSAKSPGPRKPQAVKTTGKKPVAAPAKATSKPAATISSNGRGVSGQFRKLADTLRHKRWAQFLALLFLAYCLRFSFFARLVLQDFNPLEIFPSELSFPLILAGVTSLLTVSVLFWLSIFKSFTEKLIAVVSMALLMYGYDSGLQSAAPTLRAFVPALSDGDPMPIVSLLYLLMLFAIAIGITLVFRRLQQRVKQLSNDNVNLALVVLIGYLFIVPAYQIAKILPTMLGESHTQAAEFAAPKNPADPEKPDIYYIVLDRYTNDTVLKEQFDYDNTPFTNNLRDNGFYVNPNASGNYPYTAMSVASTITAQYTNKLVEPYKDSETQSRTLYHNLIYESPVIKALKQGGYQYYSIGSWYGATYNAPLADRTYMYEHQLSVFGKNKDLHGIEATSFLRSPYYRFSQLTSSWWPFKITDRDSVADVRDQLNYLTDVSNEPAGGRFIFAHILVPHDPFNFNADGSLSAYPTVDNQGRPIKDKYLNQVQFINTQMTKLVENIQNKSDGKAVVLFSSDEGPYPDSMNSTVTNPGGAPEADGDGGTSDNMTTWPSDWLHMKFGILQAVHIPKATNDDLTHMSSVNMFRIVLNRYLGYDLPYLPQCQYGLKYGSHYEYDYTDITSTFTDNEPAECKDMQSIPTVKR